MQEVFYQYSMDTTYKIESVSSSLRRTNQMKDSHRYLEQCKIVQLPATHRHRSNQGNACGILSLKIDMRRQIFWMLED